MKKLLLLLELSMLLIPFVRAQCSPPKKCSLAEKEKNDISDMTYVSDDRMLCPLMMFHPITADPYSTVVFIDPSQTSNYSANLIFDEDHYYPKIDCINYQYSNCKHILLGGLNTWFLKKISHPASTYDCNNQGTIEVSIIDPIQNIIEFKELTPIENDTNWESPNNIILKSHSSGPFCIDISNQ